MSLGTANRDGGRTSESGHLRPIQKGVVGEVLTGLAVSQRGAGANMSVDIAIGDVVIPRSDATYGHPSFNDAVYNQVIAAADVSNPRRDIVVMYIDYAQSPSTGVSNNTNGVVKVKVVAGTPAGSPADPTDSAIQSSVGASNPYVKLARVRVAAGASSITNSVIDDLRTMAQFLDNGGWNSLSQAWDHWQFSAFDTTYKIATITVPDSSVFTLGQKVRYWQLTGGWKYGIIVKLASGTSIQVYQGHVGGYTLVNERIYLPAYSRDKTPNGFPADPNIWSVTVTDSTLRDQGSPVTGTWYNIGAVQIGVPMGVWDLQWMAQCGGWRAGATSVDIKGTLSTANNTESDPELTAGLTQEGASGTQGPRHTTGKRKIVALTANTIYYLNASTSSGSNAVQFLNGTSRGVMRAICAYL